MAASIPPVSHDFLLKFIIKFVCLLVFALEPITTHAQTSSDDESIYTVIIKKQEKKKQERWSLASWYETKEKIRLMDMWLALHSSYSLYEFFIGGDTATISIRDPNGTSNSPEKIAQRGEIGAYASIFGLQAQYIDLSQTETGWDGSFHFRLLGTAVQNTNLTLIYGVRHRAEFETSTQFHNHFGGVSMTLYLHKVFGVEGLYKSFFPVSAKLGRTLEGSRTEASIFLDFNILRFFATWFEEPLIYFTDEVQTSRAIRSGVSGGLKLFF